MAYLNYLHSRGQYDFLGNLSNGRSITATEKRLEVVISTCYVRSLIMKSITKIFLGKMHPNGPAIGAKYFNTKMTN